MSTKKMVIRTFMICFLICINFGRIGATAENDSSMEKDRQAILAMAGTYKVTFNFVETISFVEDYELKDPSVSHAHEVVKVIAEEDSFISLQHFLVVGGNASVIVKHWRQDWFYEPKEIFEYIGHNSWRRRALSDEERKGKWAQLVYQVDDSPRYAAVAEWSHENGVSTWDPSESWRPLPRRDATKRDDYDVVAAVNRHVITPTGWVHEQDNTKLMLRGGISPLVREEGFNTYIKSSDFNHANAESYWKATAEFWAGVRDEWSRIARENETYGLTLEGEPAELYDAVLGLAYAIDRNEIDTASAIEKAREIIRKYTD